MLSLLFITMKEREGSTQRKFLKRIVHNCYSLTYMLKNVQFLSHCVLYVAISSSVLRFVFCSFYRGSDAALIVYDITKRSTYDNVTWWLKELRKGAGKDIAVMLVGNKSDLESKREVNEEEAKIFSGL